MLAPPPEDTGAARTDATHGNSETRHITARLRFVSSEDPSLSCLIITCKDAMSLNGVKGQARTTNKECNF